MKLRFFLPGFMALGLLAAGTVHGEDSLQACTVSGDCSDDEACILQQCQAPPLYVLLYNHYEDHINSELSEERLLRFLPAVSARVTSYPALRMTWNLQFTGADAESLQERTDETGLVETIRDGMTKGFLTVGYQAAHEPTDANNAMTALAEDATWSQVRAAAWVFLNEGKDRTRGDIDPNRMGGARLVKEVFGGLTAVSGFGNDSAETETVRELAPEVLMTGFSDHSDEEDTDNVGPLRVLMMKLSPENDTPGGLFWMEGALRINDGNPKDHVRSANFSDNEIVFKQNVDRIQWDRTQVLNAFLASKFIYAKVPPTDYAYDNPDAPELTEEYLREDADKEAWYLRSLQNLDYLLDEVMMAHPHARFVSPNELMQLFVNDVGTAIPYSRIWQIVRYLEDAGDPLPGYVEADGYYYTLAESWYLLEQTLTYYAEHRDFPKSVLLARVHGPLNDAEAAAETTDVEVTTLLAAIAAHGRDHASSPQWVPETMTIGEATLNPAEYLHAMVTFFLALDNDPPVEKLAIPPLSPHSALHDDLMALGSFRYPGISWTLKPARHR